MDAIRTVDLTEKYKDTTSVANLNLQIKQGELFSLPGVNGAGKTTIIKMLSCLTQPTSGDAFLNGKSICNNAADVKAMIAVSTLLHYFQQPLLQRIGTVRFCRDCIPHR